MNEQLENLVRIGQLKIEPSSAEEIEGLVHSGVVRLADAKNESLSLESRFDLAYNAAFALSLAALRHAGYRSETRYHVFLCLTHTLGLANEKQRVLDQAHRKRNLSEYEGATEVDESLLGALVRVTDEVAQAVESVIRT